MSKIISLLNDFGFFLFLFSLNVGPSGRLRPSQGGGLHGREDIEHERTSPGWPPWQLVYQARFIGRSCHAQKAWTMPLDSWRWADSKNVRFIKIGQWPFQKRSFVSNTISFSFAVCFRQQQVYFVKPHCTSTKERIIPSQKISAKYHAPRHN